jgi:heavy metal sensor kinase
LKLPIRARLTIWYLVLLAVIIAAGGAFVVFSLRSSLVRGVDSSLKASAHEIVVDYSGGGSNGFGGVTSAALADLQGPSEAQVLAADGKVVVSTPGSSVASTPLLTSPQAASVSAGKVISETVPLGKAAEAYRILAQPYSTSTGPAVLVVATPLTLVENSVHRVIVAMAIFGPIAILLAAAGGWWLAGRGLRPVAVMTDKAASIGVDNLAERVDTPRPRDELRRLAETFNGMLDRIQSGMQRERRFISDASHELRTPIAVARMELDVSLGEPDLNQGSRDALESALDEVDRMSGIVEDLLTLARVDEGGLVLDLERMDLRIVCGEVVEQMATMAAAADVSLDVSGPSAPVAADPQKLAQVVRNLVANAIRHTGKGTGVGVLTWSDAREAGVRVADHGPGMPPEVLEHVFDRFYRADPARKRDAGGSGLGLAISREIVEGHGGRIWAESGPAGSVFAFSIPAGAVTAER